MKKVTILTGFLGAGKTTFLNFLLKQNTGTKYAIIENEFGEQGIDGNLIMRASDAIVEMNNGCLCCSLNDNLYELLNDLYEKRDDFDELIIECTGVADPSAIAEPFLVHPAIKKEFELQHVICLADAELIEDQLTETEEAIKQIAFSNVILINKSDLVAEKYLHELSAKLAEINPLAQVVHGSKTTYPDIASLPVQREFVIKKAPQAPKKTVNNSFAIKAVLSNLADPSKLKRHSSINTFSFVYEQLFDLEMLKLLFWQLLTFQSKGLYRVKAIVYAADHPHPYIFQSVGQRLNIEPYEPTEKEESISRFVFIGRDLKPEGFDKLLRRALKVRKEVEG